MYQKDNELLKIKRLIVVAYNAITSTYIQSTVYKTDHPSFFTLNHIPSILHPQSYTLQSSLLILYSPFFNLHPSLSTLQKRSQFDTAKNPLVLCYICVSLGKLRIKPLYIQRINSLHSKT